MWIAASVEVDHKFPELVLRVFDLARNLRALCDQAGKGVGISQKNTPPHCNQLLARSISRQRRLLLSSSRAGQGNEASGYSVESRTCRIPPVLLRRVAVCAVTGACSRTSAAP
jgi:hypothetical protein